MLLAGTALIGKRPHGMAPDHGASVANAIAVPGSSPTGCAERGGIIALRSSGRTFCKIDFPDGGRICADTSDCLGGCVISAAYPRQSSGRVTGTCRASNASDGCLTPVVNGTAAEGARCALF